MKLIEYHSKYFDFVWLKKWTHKMSIGKKKIYKRKYIHTTLATANSEFIKWNFCIYVLKCSKCHWIVLWCFLLGDRLLFIDSSWDWSKMPRKNFVLHQIVCIGDKNLFESKTFSLLLLAIDVLHIIISIGWRRKTKNRSHDVVVVHSTVNCTVYQAIELTTKRERKRKIICDVSRNRNKNNNKNKTNTFNELKEMKIGAIVDCNEIK